MIDLLEEPRGSGFHDLADWIEVRAEELGISSVTESTLSRALSQHGLPVAQDAVAGAIGVMRRRGRLLGESYPFRPAPGRLSFRPDVRTEFYLALTSLSTVSHDHLAGTELARLATAFEVLAEEILASTWGSSGRSLHFGWPTRVGRPRSFPLAVTWLAQRLGLPEREGYRPPERQDAGVDLVAWNELADGTTADVRLGQCTISRDLDRKSRDIDVALWQTWVDFPRPPAVVLLVPYQVPRRSAASVGLGQRGVLLMDRVLMAKQWAVSDLGHGVAKDLRMLFDR